MFVKTQYKYLRSIEMYLSIEIFDVLNFFNEAEAITWENFVLAKVEPGITKGCNLQDVIYEEFITLPGFRLNGTEFDAGQPG